MAGWLYRFVTCVETSLTPAWAQNYTYANAFMTCICNGTKDATAVQASDPRSQLLSDAGVCESCNSTPWLVQRDLAVSPQYSPRSMR